MRPGARQPRRAGARPPPGAGRRPTGIMRARAHGARRRAGACRARLRGRGRARARDAAPAALGDYLQTVRDLRRGHARALGAHRPERLRGPGHGLPHDGRSAGREVGARAAGAGRRRRSPPSRSAPPAASSCASSGPRAGARAARRGRGRPLPGVRGHTIWLSLSGLTVAEVLRQVLAGHRGGGRARPGSCGCAARSTSARSARRRRGWRARASASACRRKGTALIHRADLPLLGNLELLLDRAARRPASCTAASAATPPATPAAPSPEPLLLPESSEPLGPRYHARVVALVALERGSVAGRPIRSSWRRRGRAEAPLPAGRQRAGTPRTASGRKVSEITLDAVVRGEIGADDIRVSAETLRQQAEFAAAGRQPTARRQPAPRRRARRILGRRAARALRGAAPRPLDARSSSTQLARRLEARDAVLCAALVREARGAYVRRGLAS